VAVYSRGVPGDGRAAGGRSPAAKRQEATMETAIDPVCGMQVKVEGCPHTLEHEGVTYYFCAKGCMLEFRDDPGKYLDPSYVPSM
jgi:YHS domain-containing protein